MTLSFTQFTVYSYTSIGHIIIGQLHYLWGKIVEQSIIVGHLNTYNSITPICNIWIISKVSIFFKFHGKK